MSQKENLMLVGTWKSLEKKKKEFINLEKVIWNIQSEAIPVDK